MRWTLAALVLINVGLFMWASWYRDGGQLRQPLARTPVNPEKMKSLAEAGVRAKLLPRERSSAVKILKPVKRICHAVGPFETNREAVRAGERLKKVALEYTLRTIEVSENRYQLYLPSFRSRKAAQTMQRRLSRLGFRDNALIFEKGMRNAISVGIFKVKENAAGRRKDLQKKGIRTRERVLTTKHSRFWLDVPTDEVKLSRLRKIRWRSDAVAIKESTCALAPAPASK
jgi:hypothetical protein